MKLTFKNFSIRTYVALFILVFTIIPSLIINLVTYYSTIATVKHDYMKNYLDSVFEDINTNITTLSHRICVEMLAITNDTHLSTALNSKALTYDEKNQVVQNSLSYLASSDIIAAAEIITKSDNKAYRYSVEKFNIEPPSADFLKSLNKTQIAFSSKTVTHNGRRYIAIGKEFYNYYTRYNDGYLIFYIDESILLSTYSKSILQKSIFYISVDDYIISHADSAEIGKRPYIPDILLDNTSLYTAENKYGLKSQVIKANNIKDNIKINCIVSFKELYSIIWNINKTVIYTSILTIILSFVLAFLISKKLINDTIQLKDRLISLTDYRDKISLEKSSCNEIYQLEQSFNILIETINELIEKNNLEKEKQRHAELKALQAQINPHFIYNSLDSISWLAKIYKQKDIEELSQTLASFFRLSLNKGKSFVQVKDEIEHVQSYLKIYRIQYPDLFDVEFDIDKNIENFYMLKITIQPLVENAIKHGFKELDYKGLLYIKGYLDENDDIIFKVCDNGKGMNFNPLEASNTNVENTSGYGISNVQERLILQYGQDYGLSFESELGYGTTAIIRIKKLDADALQKTACIKPYSSSDIQCHD